MSNHQKTLPTLRLLVAEDDRNLREALLDGLANLPLDIDSVADGDQLQAAIDRHPPDILITDIDMPGAGGLETVKLLGASDDGIPRHVIVISARSDLQTRLEAFSCGCDDFVPKPFSMDELRARTTVGLRRLQICQELEHSREMIIRREKMATIGVLAGGIAHEFNNIMSGIAGFAQLARKDEKHRDRLVEVALEQAKRSQRITSSLSTFAGSASRQISRGSIDDIIEKALCLLSKRLTEGQVSVERRFAPELPHVEVNLGQIQQVMVHLLLNAQQALQSEGTIEIRTEIHDDTLVIEVDDDGPGIEKGDEVRIFDPFFTTSLASDGEEERSGLGLTFAVNVLESHRGALTLETSRLGGACFRVTLPLVATPTSCAPTVEARPVAREIVVVEDNPMVQEIVCETLSSDNPSCFSTGPQALAHCRQCPPDIVLLDLGLEGSLDGWQVLDELGQLPSPPPVLLMTGQIDLDLARIPPQARVSVIYKPFGLVELESSISNLLAPTP